MFGMFRSPSSSRSSETIRVAASELFVFVRFIASETLPLRHADTCFRCLILCNAERKWRTYLQRRSHEVRELRQVFEGRGCNHSSSNGVSGQHCMYFHLSRCRKETFACLWGETKGIRCIQRHDAFKKQAGAVPPCDRTGYTEEHTFWSRCGSPSWN